MEGETPIEIRIGKQTKAAGGWFAPSPAWQHHQVAAWSSEMAVPEAAKPPMPKGVSSRSLPAPTSDPRTPGREGFHEEDFRAPSEGSNQQASAMRVLQSMSEMDFPVAGCNICLGSLGWQSD